MRTRGRPETRRGGARRAAWGPGSRFQRGKQPLDDGPARLDALAAKHRLEITDERLPKRRILLGSRQESIGFRPQSRQLLRALDPPTRRGGERGEEFRETLFANSRHRATCSLDAARGSDLPSTSWRSFARHREMRLAI